MGWKILSMQHRTADGYVIDVVSCYEKKDDPGYYRKIFYNVFEGQPGEDFVPYEDLTEATVVGWVKDALGPEAVTQTETDVDAEALANKEEIENPTVEQGLPW